MKKSPKLDVDFVHGAIAPRMFTYDQLANISDTNYEVLNRSVDPAKLNKDDMFICIPLLIHHFAFCEPVEPHLRVAVTSQINSDLYAFQDMTFEQYVIGKVIS